MSDKAVYKLSFMGELMYHRFARWFLTFSIIGGMYFLYLQLLILAAAYFTMSAVIFFGIRDVQEALILVYVGEVPSRFWLHEIKKESH